MKEALILISFHCLCPGLPHHLRIFRLGPSQTFTSGVFDGEGGERGSKSPALVRREEVI